MGTKTKIEETIVDEDHPAMGNSIVKFSLCVGRSCVQTFNVSNFTLAKFVNVHESEQDGPLQALKVRMFKSLKP